VQRFTFSGEFVAATLVQPADIAALASLRIVREQGVPHVMIENANGAIEACRLGERCGAFVDAAGHCTEWAWTAVGAATVPSEETP
jgi:hypothetical protein